MIDDSVATTKVLSIFVLSFMCWLFSKIITKSLQKFLSKKQIAPYLLNCHRLVVVTINSPSQEQNIVHLQNFSSYCLFVTPLLHLQKIFLLKNNFSSISSLPSSYRDTIFSSFSFSLPFLHSQTKYFPIFTKYFTWFSRCSCYQAAWGGLDLFKFSIWKIAWIADKYKIILVSKLTLYLIAVSLFSISSLLPTSRWVSK